MSLVKDSLSHFSGRAKRGCYITINERIREFVAQAAHVQSDEEARVLCEQEIEALYRQHTLNTVKKNSLNLSEFVDGWS